MRAEKTVRISALDTLFFRESRPFDAIGGSELASVFPPPPRTVLGAIRSAVGDSLGADWKQFHDNTDYKINGENLRTLIGYGDDLGALKLNGIWLLLDGERLYPAPRFLWYRGENVLSFNRLSIGHAVETHLGKIYLPRVLCRDKKYKAPEDAWLSGTGMECVLNGGIPGDSEFHQQKTLVAKESRLGIARNNDRRTVEKSLLYQTCHVRPVSSLAIEADLSGLKTTGIGERIVRLGGEGRMASISIESRLPLPSAPRPDGKTIGLVLILLSPARFGSGKNGWLPPDFTPEIINGVKVWRGTIKDIKLTIYTSVLGKARREGGWDMAAKTPRTVQSLIPAGSCYYCTVDERDITEAIGVLHGAQIGKDQHLGRGTIVCGLWNQNEFSTDHPGGKL